MKTTCREGRCASSGFARSINCLCCLFSTISLHSGLDTCFHTKFAFQGQEPASKENLKIYDPDSDDNLHHLKESQRDNEQPFREYGEIASDVVNLFKNFPTVDSAFGDDFTVLPTFVSIDTLEHLKNCGKNTRKSADAVAQFASSKMLSFSFTTSKCVSKARVQILRMMLLPSLERFSRPPLVICYFRGTANPNSSC